MNKSLVILAGILSIALIILAVFYFLVFKSQQNEPKTERLDIIKTDLLEEGKIASGFPKDLPIEPGSTTKQSYEAVAKDGRKQSTLSTTTSKTLAQAVKVYRDYFLEKDWLEVGESDNSSEVVRASFRKNDDFLVIETQKDPETEQNTIEITLIESAK